MCPTRATWVRTAASVLPASDQRDDRMPVASLPYSRPARRPSPSLRWGLLPRRARRPPPRRGLRPRRVPGRQRDRLHFEEALQALGPELTPEARLLVTAERRGEVDRHRRVQHVGAGTHLARHTQ